MQGWAAILTYGDAAGEALYYEKVTLAKQHFLRHLSVRNGLGLVSALVVVACGGGTTASAPSPSPGITVTLRAQNGSHAIGTARIVKGAGSFTLTIKLTGLAPGSSHISHVHAGSCAAPGGIAYALQQVIADSSGAATAASTVLDPYSIPASGWYVNVHHGPDFTESDYAPSDACGDLTAA